MGLEDAGGGGGLTAVGSKKKSGKRVESKKTFCFTLELKDLESCEYNEFNWLDLVAQEEDKKRKRSSFGEDEEEDEEMKALARKYEAKYGSEAIKKKKKVRRLDDYADLGYGYDSNDPFIDNSDAYDEIVPRDVTTAHGGFYVNSGPLEFKERDSAAEDSDLDQTQPLPNTSNKAASATAAPPTSTTTTNPGPKKRKRPKRRLKLLHSRLKKYLKRILWQLLRPSSSIDPTKQACEKDAWAQAGHAKREKEESCP
ncbi:Ubinuclein2like [Caligus rogercresseyi]|uniref:Ubinuclein2like n=1 Tax=Caligus rogercresseyi TaxID=217165 RepID=A0A7T8H384_CALRO|nr:Ubinuclein2like [Caligus rogercresseyi]